MVRDKLVMEKKLSRFVRVSWLDHLGNFYETWHTFTVLAGLQMREHQTSVMAFINYSIFCVYRNCGGFLSLPIHLLMNLNLLL